MSNRLAFLPTAVVALVVLACAGCGDSYGDRLEVSGTIKLKGELLDHGAIEFYPLSEGSGGATKSGGPVTNGSYKIKREDGLSPGKYRVSITSGDGRTPAGAPDDAPPGPTGANIVSKDRIPPDYNVNSKQQVEIKSGQLNVFDYDIP